MFGKRALIVGSIILAGLAVPVLGQQSPWQNGSFLNGASKPITSTPIKLPKTPPAVKVPPAKLPTAAGQPKSSIFSLSNIYPKISLGSWPVKSSK